MILCISGKLVPFLAAWWVFHGFLIIGYHRILVPVCLLTPWWSRASPRHFSRLAPGQGRGHSARSQVPGFQTLSGLWLGGAHPSPRVAWTKKMSQVGELQKAMIFCEFFDFQTAPGSEIWFSSSMRLQDFPSFFRWFPIDFPCFSVLRFEGQELLGDEEVSSLGLLRPGACLTALLSAPLKVGFHRGVS